MPPPLALGIGLGLGFGGSLWTPRSEPDLAFWYDGDTVTLTSGNVSSWTDLSGNGRHLTDGGVAGRRPAPIAGGLNGHQTVRFNGTSNYLSATFSDSQPVDIFVALKVITLGLTNSNDIVFDGGNNLSQVLLCSTGGTDLYAGGVAIGGAVFFADGAFQQGECQFNGASSQMFAGATGTSFIAPGNCGTAAPGGFTFGATAAGARFTNIEVAGAFGFSSVKSAAIRALARGWMTARWGV